MTSSIRDVWVNSLFHDLEGQADVAAISDVRFLNECESILEIPGSQLVKVTKPGVQPKDTPSDKGVDRLRRMARNRRQLRHRRIYRAHACRLAGQVLAGMPSLA